MKYVLSLDQGTTSSRAVLFDDRGAILAMANKELTQIYPRSGWVEHDPEEIWSGQRDVLLHVLKESNVQPNEVVALGITNQRETAIVWDRITGEPIHNAIVWQDKRTAPLCEKLKADGLQDYVRENTGLVIDSYFSATKIRWMLDHVEGAREKANRGELAFGTVDSWLLWKLTDGNQHATDVTNASRTMLYNIRDCRWDDTLLKALDIPASMMPTVYPSASHFGDFHCLGMDIPVCAILGDQQAALFGQGCFTPGSAKNTYGTGCFVLMNTGTDMHRSANGLLTTIAWQLDSEPCYALEGSLFITGAAVQWLRDSLRVIDCSADSEYFAQQVPDDHDVYVVPAFAGLGTPYWDMYARGAIFGLTRDTGKTHIIRATLESIAYQTKDVLAAMEADAKIPLQVLKVDGGASVNNFLMQFQADILGTPVERAKVIESTAQGSAYLAGVYQGLWRTEDVIANREIDQVFTPHISVAERQKRYHGWQKAVQRTLHWAKD